MVLVGLRLLPSLLRVSTRARINYNASRCKFTSMDEVGAEEMLNEIYEIVRGQRFRNIVVMQTKFKCDPRYYLVASAFNARHLSQGTMMINKLFKQQIKSADLEYARVSESENWNVLDFQSVVVHLFHGRTRETYDLEQLWSVGPKFDELSNPPVVAEQGQDKLHLEETALKPMEVRNDQV